MIYYDEMVELTEEDYQRMREVLKTTRISVDPETGYAVLREDTAPRKPDDDLEAYLEYNSDIFTLGEIANIHAEVPGHHDEDSWFWVLELKDGRFILTSAWCDYTGWDCQSGGHSHEAHSATAAAMLAPEEDYGRLVRKNLLAQLEGIQPFGTEVVR